MRFGGGLAREWVDEGTCREIWCWMASLLGLSDYTICEFWDDTWDSGGLEGSVDFLSMGLGRI